MQSQIKLNTLREDSSSKLFGRSHPPQSLRQLRSVRYAKHTVLSSLRPTALRLTCSKNQEVVQHQESRSDNICISKTVSGLVLLCRKVPPKCLEADATRIPPSCFTLAFRSSDVYKFQQPNVRNSSQREQGDETNQPNQPCQSVKFLRYCW